jgi:hypothetical protein
MAAWIHSIVSISLLIIVFSYFIFIYMVQYRRFFFFVSMKSLITLQNSEKNSSGGSLTMVVFAAGLQNWRRNVKEVRFASEVLNMFYKN